MLGAILLAGLTLFVGLTQTGSGDSYRVIGTVTSGTRENRPISHAWVVATSDSDFQQTRADDRGRYFFLTLLPGVYHLMAFPIDATGEGRGGSTPFSCENPDTLVELSAGVEYLANLDLVPACHP